MLPLSQSPTEEKGQASGDRRQSFTGLLFPMLC